MASVWALALFRPLGWFQRHSRRPFTGNWGGQASAKPFSFYLLNKLTGVQHCLLLQLVTSITIFVALLPCPAETPMPEGRLRLLMQSLQSLDCFNQRPQIFRLPGDLEQAVSRAWLTTKTALGDVIASTTWSLNSLMRKVSYGSLWRGALISSCTATLQNWFVLARRTRLPLVPPIIFL